MGARTPGQKGVLSPLPSPPHGPVHVHSFTNDGNLRYIIIILQSLLIQRSNKFYQFDSSPSRVATRFSCVLSFVSTSWVLCLSWNKFEGRDFGIYPFDYLSIQVNLKPLTNMSYLLTAYLKALKFYSSQLFCFIIFKWASLSLFVSSLWKCQVSH